MSSRRHEPLGRDSQKLFENKLGKARQAYTWWTFRAHGVSCSIPFARHLQFGFDHLSGALHLLFAVAMPMFLRAKAGTSLAISPNGLTDRGLNRRWFFDLPILKRIGDHITSDADCSLRARTPLRCSSIHPVD
jgi:hypothetical protein